jgi:hypothetical protein
VNGVLDGEEKSRGARGSSRDPYLFLLGGSSAAAPVSRVKDAWHTRQAYVVASGPRARACTVPHFGHRSFTRAPTAEGPKMTIPRG